MLERIRFLTAGEATIEPIDAANSFTLATDLFIKADKVLSNSAFLLVAWSVALADCLVALS